MGKEALTSAATGELVFLFRFDLGKCGNLDVEVFVGNNSALLASSIDLTCHAYRLIRTTSQQIDHRCTARNIFILIWTTPDSRNAGCLLAKIDTVSKIPICIRHDDISSISKSPHLVSGFSRFFKVFLSFRVSKNYNTCKLIKT